MARRPWWCLFVALGARPAPALAYSFPEHVSLTAQALAQLQRESPGAIEYFDALRTLAPGGRLCPREALLEDHHRRGCFVLADLAALGGDHCSSPEGLLVRWLLTDPARQRDALRALGDRPSEAELEALSEDPSPTVCGQSVPAVPAVLAVLRTYDLGSTPRGVGGFDLDVLELDQDYLCLAWHGRGHFRLPGVVAREAAGLSTPNAAGSYARHHLAALRWAGLARREPSLQSIARALATLDEGYAIHFLEDATAAGHLVVSAAVARQSRVRAMHDHYNAVGVPVTLPQALCQDARGSPRLEARCASAHPTARLRGDYALAEHLDHPDPEDLTREVAVLAVRRSLGAVLAVPEAPDDGCTRALTVCAREAPDPTAAALRCAGVYHLEGCSLATDLAHEGALAALALLPEPAAPVASRENFSEGATVLSLSTRALALPLAPAWVTTLGVGRSYASPPFNGHQVTFGAELTASWAVSEATPAALPSVAGARGWFRWAFNGANAGRARFAGVGLSLEGLRAGGPDQAVLSGLGLGLQLVPFGFTLETSERSTVRVEFLVDSLLPLLGPGSPAVLGGVGVSASLQ